MFPSLNANFYEHFCYTSDTSESLNFISPSSTREDFTAGIAERCRKLQQPGPLTSKLILNQPINQRSTTTTAYFDINSGKFSTIVSRGETNGRSYFNGVTTESFLATKTIELQSPTVVSHANKKPSYLNLACCVNGYSNYTNYDSIQRKEINKSREVSPIRPLISSINMARQPRSNENLLSVPPPVTFVKQSPLTSITKRFASLNINNDKDTTDNASMMTNGNGSVVNRKSFIQQRVEKLYGTTKILTTVKSSDSIQINGNGTITHSATHNGSTNGTAKVDEKENDEVCLPVMKHLRPEFCKQLQFMNPSSPKKSSLTRTSTGNVLLKSAEKATERIENGTSSNPDIFSLPHATKQQPIKTIEISTTEESSNSKFIEYDAAKLSNQVVSSPETIAVSQEQVMNNNCGVSNNNLIVNNKMESESQNSDTKDGNFFLKLLNTEKTRILKNAADLEKEFEDLQESVSSMAVFC